MTYTNRALIANLLGGLLALSATSQAIAQAGPSISVTYRAAELRTDQGTRSVYDRIKVAARKACNLGGAYVSSNARCRRALTGQVVAKINDPAMLAMHGGAQTQLASR